MKQRGSLTLPSPAGGISQSDADARYFRIANNLSEGVAATMRTSLGLGSIATQAAGAVAITGGTLAGITGAGFRDTSAAFDVSLVFTSAIPLDAGRTVTVDVGNANRALTLYGDFVVPSGGGTAALLGADNSFTGANTFHNAAGLVVRPSGLQDGVALKGRAGGTFSYTAAITTAALTASRTFTIPAVTGNDTFALLGIAQTFTGAQTYSGGTNSATPTILASFSNTTAAISGTQSASTGIEFIGQGFKTGTGSQETKWRIYNLPVQGSALDTGLMFGCSTNGGGYTDYMRVCGIDAVFYRGLGFNGSFALTPSLSSTSMRLEVQSSQVLVVFSEATKHTFNSTTYTLAEGVNIVAGTSTGTKIGSATTQKFAFWNATPVVQPAHIADPSGGAIQDAEARAAIVSILAWQATLGLTAAS